MQKNNRRRIAAVVVTYNRKKMLIECLDALLNQTVRLDRIIVIDNASTDGTEYYLRKHGYLNNPSLIYRRLARNLGGAGGFSKGLQMGFTMDFDWLWVMDDDAEPRSNALEILLKSLDRDSFGIVGLACRKVDHEGTIEMIHRGWFNQNAYKPTPLPASDYEKEECPIGYSSFVGLLISRKAIEKIGYPNRDFFIWLDDVEYCLRLTSVGILKLITKSIIVHKDRLTISGNTDHLTMKDYWKMYYGIRNRTYILRYHFKRTPLTLFVHILLKGSFKVIIQDGYRCDRLLTIVKAWRDGIQRRMGIRIDPDLWQKKYSH